MHETGKLNWGDPPSPIIFFKTVFYRKIFIWDRIKIIVKFDQINFVYYYPVSCNKKDKGHAHVNIIYFSFLFPPAPLKLSQAVVVYFNFKK